MREVIATKNAPEAVGSYSQAVKAGQFLFISGQLCVNPKTGELERESVSTQTTRIMENIKAIVSASGATMDDVVSCKAFLSNMNHFAEFEAVYKSYFTAPYPARMTVACAGIYDNLDVEMDAVVFLS